MKVIILTEGNSNFGMGHISRCVSFYDEFFSRGNNVFFIINGNEDSKVIIQNRCCIYIDWLNNILKIEKYIDANSVLFLDSIQATQNDVDYLSSITKLLVVIDDYKRRYYNNSIVIDWTANVENTENHLFNQKNNTLLLGIQYSVLRKAFRSSSRFQIKDLRHVLITMGGSDVRHLSLPLVLYLSEKFPFFQFYLVVGPGFDKSFKPIGIKNVQYYYSLDDIGMKNAMENVDLVISAGGQTLYELLSVHVPTIGVQVIDNQEEDLKGLYNIGFLHSILKWDDPDLLGSLCLAINDLLPKSLRKKYVSVAKKLNVGSGLSKIVNIIEKKYLEC